MRKAILHILVLAVLTSAAHSQGLIFASATGPFQAYGSAICDEQFLGARFRLRSTTNVTGIGGNFSSFGSAGSCEMFGVIMRLDSLSSLPAGKPFSAADLSRIVVSTVVTVSSSTPVDYIFPVSVTLTPGVYGLIFGQGQFGASSCYHVCANESTQNLSPDYLIYTRESSQQWGNGGFPNVRLTVYGGSVPEPCVAHLVLLAGVVAALQRRGKAISRRGQTLGLTPSHGLRRRRNRWSG